MKQKNTLTKVFSLLVVVVFIMGSIPLAFAKENENSGNDFEKIENSGKLGLGITANDVADATIDAVAKEEADSIETGNNTELNSRVEMCVSRVMENLPKANEERVEKFCKKHLEVKMKINEKKNEAEKKNNAQKGRYDEMRQEFKMKLNNNEEFRLRALAKEAQNNQKVADFAARLNENQLKVYMHLEQKTKQWCLENSIECEKRIEKWKLEKNKEKREITTEKLEKIRENYLEAKQRYKEADSNYKKDKQEFLQLKEELKQCKDGDTTEKCVELSAQANARAKEMVSNSIKLLINHLEQIKESVNENENFADEEAASISTEIDVKIKALQELSAKLESAATKEEIKAIAKEVQQLWKNYKEKAKLHALHVANARVRGVVEKSEKVEAKFQCVLDSLEEQGKDVSSLDALVEKYNEKLADAQEHYNKARLSFQSSTQLRADKDLTEAEITSITNLNQEGKKHLDLARENVKEAQELMKEIVKSIKEMGGNIDSCSAKVEQSEDDADIVVVTENNMPVSMTVTQVSDDGSVTKTVTTETTEDGVTQTTDVSASKTSEDGSSSVNVDSSTTTVESNDGSSSSASASVSVSASASS